MIDWESVRYTSIRTTPSKAKLLNSLDISKQVLRDSFQNHKNVLKRKIFFPGKFKAISIQSRHRVIQRNIYIITQRLFLDTVVGKCKGFYRRLKRFFLIISVSYVNKMNCR